MTRAIVLVGAACVAAAAAPVRTPTPGPPTADQLARSVRNLRLIALAFHNHDDARGRLPADVTHPKTGRPLLSWRVAVLPWLGAGYPKLHARFALDQPWDANRELVREMPDEYAPVRVTAGPGETFYRGFAGPGTMFEPGRELALHHVTDGTSNTVLAVEAGEPIVWTRPGDLPFDPGRPLPPLGGLFGGRFHAVLVDGSVRQVPEGFDRAVFKQAVGRHDGGPDALDRVAK